jgi:hypothetical protein
MFVSLHPEANRYGTGTSAVNTVSVSNVNNKKDSQEDSL